MIKNTQVKQQHLTVKAETDQHQQRRVLHPWFQAAAGCQRAQVLRPWQRTPSSFSQLWNHRMKQRWLPRCHPEEKQPSLHSLKELLQGWKRESSHRNVCGTCAEPGPWTSHSFTIAVSEIFLLLPILLPRRVFTNTAGLKISSLLDGSVLVWALLAFSSSSTAVGCFSGAWKSADVSENECFGTGRHLWPASFYLTFLRLLLTMLLDRF